MSRAPRAGRTHDDREPTARFLVNVLGPFDVWHAARDVTPTGLPAAVVQLVAIHEGRMSRERLTAALWPDDAPWVGRQRLRNVLHRLRARTGGLVGREGEMVAFARPARVDVVEFLAATARAVALADRDPLAALEAGMPAVMLYRGPLLVDQPDADWAHPMRVHAADRHRLLLEALAHAAAQSGDEWTARLYRHRADTADTGLG